MRVRVWAAGLGFVMVLMTAAGCAKARAQTVPDGPPLAVPPPPERVIVPAEEPTIAVAAAPPVETPVAAPAPPRATTPARQPAAAASAPGPTETARTSKPTAADVAEERKVRDVLRRFTLDIGRVSYRSLNAEGRSQYDQSKSLAAEAEQAIKNRNWVFAMTVADKAATLAAELVAR